MHCWSQVPRSQVWVCSATAEPERLSSRWQHLQAASQALRSRSPLTGPPPGASGLELGVGVGGGAGLLASHWNWPKVLCEAGWWSQEMRVHLGSWIFRDRVEEVLSRAVGWMRPCPLEASSKSRGHFLMERRSERFLIQLSYLPVRH